MIQRVRAGARYLTSWLDAEDREVLGERAIRRGILALEIVGGATVLGIAVAIFRALGGF